MYLHASWWLLVNESNRVVVVVCQRIESVEIYGYSARDNGNEVIGISSKDVDIAA